MSEQNKAVLRQWYESLERREPDFSLLAPDVVDHGIPPGMQQLGAIPSPGPGGS